MASITEAVVTTSTTDNAAVTSGSFTPAAGDLLLAIVGATGQASAGAVSDSQSLGWDLVLSVLKNSSADIMEVYVSRTTAAASSMTVTYTPAGGPTNTGAFVNVLRVAGMTRVGGDSIRQTASDANRAGAATPTPTFAKACLTANPVISAVYNAADPPGITVPSGWSQDANTGYGTPTTGIETASIDSAFTGTAVTWGGGSTTAYADVAVELDTSLLVLMPAFAEPEKAYDRVIRERLQILPGDRVERRGPRV